MVQVLHRLSGRARLKVQGLHRCEPLAKHLEQELLEDSAILQASASSTTGNVLVLFNDRHSIDSIAAHIDQILSEYRETAPEGGSHPLQHPWDRWTHRSCEEQDWPEPAPARAGLHLSLEDMPVPWHSMESAQVVEAFKTGFETGLSESEVQQRRALHGLNTLPGTFTRSLPDIVKDQMSSMPVLLTGGAAVLSLLTGGMLEGVLTLGVALLNVGIGTAVEARAEQSLLFLRETVKLQGVVLRDGHAREVLFDEVVPGDVIELQSGYRIPADGRLIRSDRLSIDESALTGESVPVSKITAPIVDGDIPISERNNMVYRGTLVVEGSGYAVVVATGKDTILGRLQSFLGEVFPPEALMVRDMRNITWDLLRLSLGACGVLAAVSLVRGYGLVRVFKESLSFIAGILPSGLSTIAVSAFALGHQDLREHRILVHRLRALGSLASVQVVCFDKTGTLTINRMAVREIFAGGKRMTIEADGFSIAGEKRPSLDDVDAAWLVKLSALCNEAMLLADEGMPSIEGSSTEKSLLQLAELAGIDIPSLRSEYPLIHITHRTEERPFMLTMHGRHKTRELTAMKGTPLEVLSRCTHTFRKGQIQVLSEQGRQSIEEENYRMAGSGLRVLGVAFRRNPAEGPSGDDQPPMRLVWAGLVGLADPIRKGAAPLIQALHRWGIRTAVITGDQSLTARHIGEELRLSGDAPLRILDATDLRGLNVAGLRSLVTQTHVFARLSPTQKLQIIQAYQDSGLDVMMVGDGFNDVLALRVADVGVAMGRSGADLARKSADLVLEEDDLDAVMVAIANGRAFYHNVRNSVRFLLTSTHSDVLLGLSERSGLLAHGPSVWKNVWTNLACLSLAVAPPRGFSTAPHPVDPSEGLIRSCDVEDSLSDAADILAGASVPGLYGVMSYGAGPEAGRLFIQSAAINEMLFALRSGKGNGQSLDQSNAGGKLRTLLSVSVGGHLLAAVLPGIGKPMAELAHRLLDAGILAACGLLSQRLFRKQVPDHPEAGQAPSS